MEFMKYNVYGLDRSDGKATALLILKTFININWFLELHRMTKQEQIWSDLGLLVFAGKVARGFSVTFRHSLLLLCNS